MKIARHLHSLLLMTLACAGLPAQATGMLIRANHPVRTDMSPRRPAADLCRAGIPKNVELAAFGVYEGQQSTNIVLGASTHATGLVSILGSAQGPRRILLLMAYEPVLWDFSRAPIGRIAGVILSGAHDQAALGLPPSIPLVLSSRDASTACSPIGYTHKGGPQLDRVARALEDATGLSLGSFGGAYKVASLWLEDVLTPDPTVLPQGSSRIRASVPATRTSVSPGKEGIDQLLASGAIRAATADDVEDWNAAATRRLKTGALAGYRSEYLRASRSYVVERDITVPRNMFGGNSALFILRPGVPMPRDSGSHNSYYLPDGTCRGPMPDCSR